MWTHVFGMLLLSVDYFLSLFVYFLMLTLVVKFYGSVLMQRSTEIKTLRPSRSFTTFSESLQDFADCLFPSIITEWESSMNTLLLHEYNLLLISWYRFWKVTIKNNSRLQWGKAAVLSKIHSGKLIDTDKTYKLLVQRLYYINEELLYPKCQQCFHWVTEY